MGLSRNKVAVPEGAAGTTPFWRVVLDAARPSVSEVKVIKEQVLYSGGFVSTFLKMRIVNSKFSILNFQFERFCYPVVLTLFVFYKTVV